VVQGAMKRRRPVEDHTSEWVLRRGMIDLVVPRSLQKTTLSRLIGLMAPVRIDGHTGRVAVPAAEVLRPSP
jgi:acetyl-CoA carboxylase beta subunit